MDLNFGFKPAHEQRLVYIRKINASEFPDAIREEADVPDHLFAIHMDDGEQIAFLLERDAAFHMARENEMIPHSVH